MEKLSKILCFCGLILIIMTAGKGDLHLISMSQILIRIGIALAMMVFGGSYIIYKNV